MEPAEKFSDSDTIGCLWLSTTSSRTPLGSTFFMERRKGDRSQWSRRRRRLGKALRGGLTERESRADGEEARNRQVGGSGSLGSSGGDQQDEGILRREILPRHPLKVGDGYREKVAPVGIHRLGDLPRNMSAVSRASARSSACCCWVISWVRYPFFALQSSSSETPCSATRRNSAARPDSSESGVTPWLVIAEGEQHARSTTRAGRVGEDDGELRELLLPDHRSC